MDWIYEMLYRIFLNQEQASRVQTRLDEEELKSRKLLQQIAKLEEQVTVMSQESDRKEEVGYFLLFYIILDC